MKKLIYSLMTVLALGCGFTACSDDDGDEVINYSTTAEKASAGTYSGTWTRMKPTGDNVETHEGTITLVATDSVGATDITFSCPDLELQATSVANVWNSSRGFQFVNNVKTNGLGAEFAGRISAEGTLTASFRIEIREGRNLTEYDYSFVGNK